ncbi:MAG: potassium-transporting ATPase subunit KdpA [Alphaproteobacteria bacterium]|jgi:K+-transporting ATPase ATPase A chain
MPSYFFTNATIQIGLFFIVLFLLAKPLGSYMARVYSNNVVFLEKFFGFIERGFYRLAKIDRNVEMDWKQYAFSVLLFSLFGFLLLFVILLFQNYLPLNPENFAGLSWHLAFNTAVSFITNTNWQSYGGESTLSYFSQMVGLSVQNFLSAAVGMSVLVALIRGLNRKNTKTIGNFWVDMIRGNLYILLPLALIYTLLLGSQGVVQSFSKYIEVPLVERIVGGKETISTQKIATGPASSQVAIKQLGTNGGGFFNVNSAHPLENPTPFSNFLEMLALILIPTALCFTYGAMLKNNRQGNIILIAMTVIFIPLFLFSLVQEQKGNPNLKQFGIDAVASKNQAGGNMEGKEVRFGIVNSALWASATTAASNGSVNSMHASFTPLGGMIPLLFIQFGEIIYGGVGSGLYGMVIYVLITVFIAGLMVGRTPEYLGKKIQAFEIKMASIAIIVPSLCVLFGTAIALLTNAGKAGILNPLAQGYTEVLYAFSSASNNNGSAFAGLTANSPFYNTALGIVMLLGRFFVLVPVLAIAGSFAGKNTVPVSAGTLSTTSILFLSMLIVIIVLVGVLTFIPSLVLGPVIEHLNLIKQ